MMLNYILLVAMAAISIVGLVLALKSKPGSVQRFFAAVTSVIALSIAVAIVVVLFPSIFTIDCLDIAAAVWLSLVAIVALIAWIAASRRDAPPAGKVDSPATQASTEKAEADPASREVGSEPTGGIGSLNAMMGG